MALRTMRVDIDFGVDLSEIKKLDSSVDDVVKSVTGGMGKAEKSVSDLGSEFSELGNSLNDISGQSSKTESAFSKLIKTVKKIGDSAGNTKIITQLKKVDGKVVKTELSFNDLIKKIKEVGTTAVKEIGKKAKENVDKLDKSLNKALKFGGTALAGLATGFLATAETSQDFIEDMGKLDTAFTTSGHSAEVGKKTYQELVGVLGETDQAVEAANHLAKLTDNEKDLQAWTEICTGVYATFGDSLPIEGLTEAANETAKVGQVVGPLADALNWAGVLKAGVGDPRAPFPVLNELLEFAKFILTCE